MKSYEKIIQYLHFLYKVNFDYFVSVPEKKNNTSYWTMQN